MKWTFSASGVGTISTSTPSARNFVSASSSASPPIVSRGITAIHTNQLDQEIRRGILFQLRGSLLSEN